MGAAPPTGWKRLAPKTSSGTRGRTPQSRRGTSRISEGQETYEGELVAASGMGLGRVENTDVFLVSRIFVSKSYPREPAALETFHREERDRENNSQKLLQKHVFTQPRSSAADQKG